jgi:uncharacterized protein
MTERRWFIDTSFVQALFNRTDQYHAIASRWSARVRTASQLWTTGAVLLEIGSALAYINRPGAADFIRKAYRTPNLQVVPADDSMLNRALDLFANRTDKQWSLTDCMSFVVMQDQGLHEALTTDHHFEQAGFVSLLLREPAQ